MNYGTQMHEQDEGTPMEYNLARNYTSEEQSSQMNTLPQQKNITLPDVTEEEGGQSNYIQTQDLSSNKVIDSYLEGRMVSRLRLLGI